MSRNPMKPKERVKIPRQKMPEQDPVERGRNFQEVNLGLPESFAHTEAMLRRQGDGVLEAERSELRNRLVLAVGLVDRHDDALAPPAQVPRYGRVVRQQPGPRIHQQDNKIRLADGAGGVL